jgi:hypothetical protein
MKTLFATIGTAKYINFIKNLCDSLQANCTLPNFDILVCTDQNVSFSYKTFSVIKHAIEHHKHPHGTLHRYHYYLEREDLLHQYDYIIHIDADMQFVDKVGQEILSERTCVVHPGYYLRQESAFFDLEDRPASHAYFDKNRYRTATYYQNCLQGGAASEFIKMSKIIRNWTNDDLSKNIIAKWHDESYMNKYMLHNKPTLELNPGYAYPETWSLPFEKKIIHLDKDHVAIRG